MVKTKKISKNDKIGDILAMHPNLAEIFLGMGFHCLGCPMSQMETLEQGCMAHGMSKKEIEDFIEKLNKKFLKK